MVEAIKVRMQTPPDANGNRKDMYPITDASAVIYNNQTVKERLDRSNFVISTTKPDYACMWLDPMAITINVKEYAWNRNDPYAYIGDTVFAGEKRDYGKAIVYQDSVETIKKDAKGNPEVTRLSDPSDLPTTYDYITGESVTALFDYTTNSVMHCYMGGEEETAEEAVYDGKNVLILDDSRAYYSYDGKKTLITVESDTATTNTDYDHYDELSENKSKYDYTGSDIWSLYDHEESSYDATKDIFAESDPSVIYKKYPGASLSYYPGLTGETSSLTSTTTTTAKVASAKMAARMFTEEDEDTTSSKASTSSESESESKSASQSESTSEAKNESSTSSTTSTTDSTSKKTTDSSDETKSESESSSEK